MSLLSGAGNPLPATIIPYDFAIATFTVAAGLSASPYEVTGSRRTYSINPTVNQASANFAAGATDFLGALGTITSGKVTTNSTDTYDILLQISTDAGTTWDSIDGANSLGGGAGGQNDSFCDYDGFTVIATPVAAATNNQFMLRVAVLDVTAPTTNAFTFTNFRLTSLILARGT